PRREAVSERAYAGPVSLARMPRDLVITKQAVDTGSVRLRGRTSDLPPPSAPNLEGTLDMSGVQPGGATITQLPKATNRPPQIDVLPMAPTHLAFHIEPLRQKIVSIRPFLAGDPPNGYMTGDPTLAPDHALVSGPLSFVRNLTEVTTERIIMTGRTETFTQN